MDNINHAMHEDQAYLLFVMNNCIVLGFAQYDFKWQISGLAAVISK